MPLQVFEIHFNPEAKDDLIFDTFYYEPEDIYEKRLGNLFMLGELKNALPSNERFLKKLAQAIKIKFYGFKAGINERALKQTLKSANAFLEDLTKNGDVSWISNLGFAVLVTSPLKSRYKLSFTKVGAIKILLVRHGHVKEISQNLEFEGIEPYPLKIFSNVVSGDLESEDRILIFSEALFETLAKKGLIEQLAGLAIFEEKEINEILRKAPKDIFGACLFIDLAGLQEREKKKLVFKEKLFEKIQQRAITKMKFVKIRLPAAAAGFKVSFLENLLKRLKARLLEVKSRFPGWPVFKKPASKSPAKPVKEEIEPVKQEKKDGVPEEKSRFDKSWLFDKSRLMINRKARLVLGLILLLLLGGAWAKIEEKRKLARFELEIQPIKEKIQQAENFLNLNQEAPANKLFLEAWQEMQSLKKQSGLWPAEIAEKEEAVRENLLKLSRLERVESPVLLFEFSKNDFLAQNIFAFKDDLYFFSPFVNGLWQLKNNTEINFFEGEVGLHQAVVLEQGPAFLSSSGQLIVLGSSGLEEKFFLPAPYEGFECHFFASFKSHLYCLSRKSGEIMRYPFWGGYSWGEPGFWLKNGDYSLTEEARAMAIDDGIWVLARDSSLIRFYGGEKEKTIGLNLFPPIDKPTKIFTSTAFSFIYVLEPAEKRIIIFSKEGELVRQYQSEAFDGLKDLAVSEDGQKAYILNNLKVYELDLGGKN